MRNITKRCLVFFLTLFLLINIAQVPTVNSKENGVLVEVVEAIATKRSEYISLANPTNKSFNTLFKYNELKYTEPMITNIATSEVDFNLTGILNVNVIHVNGSQVSNLPIKLEKPSGTILVNATTNSNGTYAFEHLGLNDTYWVTLVYDGAAYYKDFSFTNESSAQLNIEVYETTRSDEDIVITAYQVFIGSSENLLSVIEYLTYENVGINVFNNSLLSVWLPQEMHDFSSSIMDCCIQVYEDGALFDPMDPIMPGKQYSMWVTYYLDVVSSDYIFRKKIEYNTEAFHLFIENKEELEEILAPGLENQGNVTIADIEHTFFMGSNLEAGINLAVNLVGLGPSLDFTNQIVGIILISMIPTFLISYSIIRRKHKGTSVEKLEAKKRVILKKIIQLEAEYESGDISKNKYENLRSKHRKRVIELMQHIDETRSQQPQKQQHLSEQRTEEQLLLSTLEKVEEDFNKGLISEEGYQKIKAIYEKRRIEAMEKLRKFDETANNGE
jgi:hypothetical protein